jgi:hypothetical protein
MDKAESERMAKTGEKTVVADNKKNMYEEMYDNKSVDVKSA